MKKSLKSAGIKVLAAILCGGFYWFYLKEGLSSELLRLAALGPSIFLCLLAFGELLLTFLYQITGLQKKIDETAAPPMGSVGGPATHFLGEYSGSMDTSLKGDHKNRFFQGKS